MDEGDWSDAKAYPMTSLQNPLYVWIHDLLSLKNIPMEEGFLPPPNPIDTPYPWEDKTPGRERWWNETLVYDEKKYGLRDIYIAQGWRTDNLTEAQDAYLPVWERLELNRQRAVANFGIK
ncbi:hypothetical protein CMQ_6564 [Grosmannia clavigera kw1407]|uniref:Uncharacterized protein n=1 Tax=Grosmannia clavigera (strain kw1407 / UAMH 11150) TaxID=655863 RepID=F0X6N3_GROCL|nr:uncharacterized protein CMQ_6564 [Grosmannia clavigera kw1407]EFX06243.1 hypothetical protein CMQ_6564 [Grosmannia clavigera kw1407]